MRTHDLGRLYWHTLRLTGAPFVHRGRTSTISRPYRTARPLILRLPRGRGIAVGWWHEHKTLDVSRHLAEALVLDPENYVIPGEDQYYGADPARVP